MQFLVSSEAGPTPVPAPLFVPVRGCSGCEFRGVCHDTRQKIQDPLREAGRQAGCEFHVSLRRQFPFTAVAPAPAAPAPAGTVRVFRVFGAAWRRVRAKVAP